MNTGGRRLNSGKSPGSRSTQFRPGVSGNRRPNNSHAIRTVAEFKRMLHETVGEDGWRKVCGVIYKQALEGKEWACRELADRFMGKAVQHLDVEVDIAPAETVGNELELLNLLIDNQFPERLWPPMLLARFQNGMIARGVKQIQSREVQQ